MNLKKIIYCLIFFLLSAKLYGQAVLNFEFNCDEAFVRPVQTNIKLGLPNGTTERLFSDTIRNLGFIKKAYFKKSGNYKLSVYTSGVGLKRDSTFYEFTINGKEKEVNIYVSFSENKSQIFRNGQWIEENSIPRGTISVFKYYSSPKSIKIRFIDAKSAEFKKYSIDSVFYKGPFFELTNLSKDTIYGRYLPGYFWGTLMIKIKNTTWSRKYTGTIDFEFVDSPPLYPGSCKIASVGSFGLFNLKSGIHCKYELNFTTKWDSPGATKYLSTDSIEWWTDSRNYYRLIYEFEVN